MSAAPGTDWEDLRKQARQHENEIDAKLMSFSKLCSNYVARDQTSHHHALIHHHHQHHHHLKQCQLKLKNFLNVYRI